MTDALRPSSGLTLIFLVTMLEAVGEGSLRSVFDNMPTDGERKRTRALGKVKDDGLGGVGAVDGVPAGVGHAGPVPGVTRVNGSYDGVWGVSADWVGRTTRPLTSEIFKGEVVDVRVVLPRPRGEAHGLVVVVLSDEDGV